ncbi:MAG: hypothetical protein AVDCRST_MAG73-136, partial [uncultured Thermomicrobiales bacterium]
APPPIAATADPQPLARVCPRPAGRDRRDRRNGRLLAPRHRRHGRRPPRRHPRRRPPPAGRHLPRWHPPLPGGILDRRHRPPRLRPPGRPTAGARRDEVRPQLRRPLRFWCRPGWSLWRLHRRRIARPVRGRRPRLWHRRLARRGRTGRLPPRSGRRPRQVPRLPAPAPLGRPPRLRPRTRSCHRRPPPRVRRDRL